jgi:ribosome-associated protein
VNDSTIESRVSVAAHAAIDKKAFDLDVLAVGKLTSIADYFILCSASNERQASAIADNVVSQLKEQLGVKPLLVEGTVPGRWVLLDFGDFIVHIFTEDVRRFYGLERLWGDAPNVTAELVEAGQRAFQKTS